VSAEAVGSRGSGALSAEAVRSGGNGPIGAEPVRVSPGWLLLREPADAAARSAELAECLGRYLATAGLLVIHDLGGGSGAMGRWLGPRLPGPQHWVVHDRDADLLRLAVAGVPRPAAAGAGFALAVSGRVTLAPEEPLDAPMGAAFNAHQRRDRRLGADAVPAAVDALRGTGAELIVRPSPWRLDAAHADLMAEWFEGWVAAACEQDPELAAEAGAYMDRRLAQAAAGELAVTVDHADLLVLP
jgi:hypothetical protein